MTNPSQLVLHNDAFRTRGCSLFKNTDISFLVLPLDVHHSAKASLVKSFECCNVPSVCGPCFRAVQQGGDDNGSVNFQFGDQSDALILEESGPQFSKCSRFLLDPVLDLSINIAFEDRMLPR